MSLHTHEALDIEAQVADFDTFLSARDFTNCDAILDNLFDIGEKALAIRLGRQMLAAKMSIRPHREMNRDYSDRIDSHTYGQRD